MPRGGRRKPPATDAGCGYKARVSGNSVTIFPTILNANCSIKVGLGDATFIFNPLEPPNTIKRIITKDASGSYAPLVELSGVRHTKSFSEVVQAPETFTDADGKVTELTFTELKDYKEEYVAGKYVASGTQTSDRDNANNSLW